MNTVLKRLARHLGWRTREAAEQLDLGAFSIELPPGHLLPHYQSRHPRYDRFLPHLASHLPAASAVIDVGANCGDTVAAMASRNAALGYLCIEPDPVFHAYLLRNAQRLRSALPGLRLQALQAMVGKAVVSASLEGGGGSRHAKPGENGHRTATLDDLLAPLDMAPVALLKSDVDGFDFDVLRSAPLLLERQRPLLFFECQIDDEAQRQGFQELLPWLQAVGYTRWAAFDNFGEVMLANTEPGQIAQLLDYIWQQTRQRSTRTVYYLDLLAGGADAAPCIDAALSRY